MHAYFLKLDIIDGKASFIYGGSFKVPIPSILDAAANAINAAGASVPAPKWHVGFSLHRGRVVV